MITEQTETASNSAVEPKATKKPRVGARVAPVATKKPKSGNKASLAKKAPKSAKKATGARDGSKAAKILDLLKRPSGVTSKELQRVPSWSLTERAKLKFAWEVYNVSNSIRFDDGSYFNSTFNYALTYPGFGFYGGRLGSLTFRRMQFGLRADF